MSLTDEQLSALWDACGFSEPVGPRLAFYTGVGLGLELQDVAQQVEPTDPGIVSRVQAAVTEWRDEAFGSQHMSQLKSDTLEQCATDIDAALASAPVLKPLALTEDRTDAQLRADGDEQVLDCSLGKSDARAELLRMRLENRVAEADADVVDAQLRVAELETRVRELEADCEVLYDEPDHLKPEPSPAQQALLAALEAVVEDVSRGSTHELVRYWLDKTCVAEARVRELDATIERVRGAVNTAQAHGGWVYWQVVANAIDRPPAAGPVPSSQIAEPDRELEP